MRVVPRNEPLLRTPRQISGQGMLLRKESPPQQNHDVLAFLHSALTNGQPQAKARGYVPLPDNVVKQIETHWSTQLPEAWKVSAAH